MKYNPNREEKINMKNSEILYWLAALSRSQSPVWSSKIRTPKFKTLLKKLVRIVVLNIPPKRTPVDTGSKARKV
jgi:hypothetical protein